MKIGGIGLYLGVIVYALILGSIIKLLIFSIQALRKYVGSKETRTEKTRLCASLGEVLKTYRVKKNMTQELVAERLGVSRQAVSKWESGVSDPSTSNLLALAKLYGVSADEILQQVHV